MIWGFCTVRPAIRLLLLTSLLLSATALSPLAVADPTGPSRSATPAVRAAVTRPSPHPKRPRRHVPPPLTTRIIARPKNPQVGGSATFTWEANVPKSSGVRFRCRLTGPGHPARTPMGTCPPAVRQASATRTTGTRTFTRLSGSRVPYRFMVQAYIPAKAPARARFGSSDVYRWRMFSLFAPDRYSPPGGARFNNPLGDRQANRTNLLHVIRTINSMPGYREAYPGLCPTSVADSLGTIRMSLYSLTDGPVAKALVRASKRCISVQVLMNNHLSAATDPAWSLLEKGLGTDTSGRNFAHLCSFGCRGSGVLHTKIYLFNSTVAPRPALNRIVRTVMIGSSNMTSNAAEVQWNDLYTVRNQQTLFNQYSTMFASMARDSGFRRQQTVLVAPPTYQTVFWPFRRGAVDPYLSALRSVHCKGANGGAGVRGRSVVYINMHAWFNTRGMALANQVRRMYSQGCQVHVLYSFMSYPVFKKLHKGTGSAMTVRRTLFSHDGKVAYIYSHFKNIAVSGYVGRDRSAQVVWTGSNNFTNEGFHFDEVSIRIASASAFAAYRNQFNVITRLRSSPTYANFSEPHGGGRAPAVAVRSMLDRAATPAPAEELPPPGTPTIVSPQVVIDADGDPHVRD